MTHAALYARVSTSKQETENQLIELRQYCERRAWTSQEFIDEGFSGALTKDDRPGLSALMDLAKSRKMDYVIVWDFSRFARSMSQLVEAMDLFRAWKIGFISLREGVDTSTANGRLIFGIFASLAEFERELIRERIQLGIARARLQGKKIGRPKLILDMDSMQRLRQEGLTLQAIANQLGLGKGTVQRALASYQKPI